MASTGYIWSIYNEICTFVFAELIFQHWSASYHQIYRTHRYTGYISNWICAFLFVILNVSYWSTWGHHKYTIRMVMLCNLIEFNHASFFWVCKFEKMGNILSLFSIKFCIYLNVSQYNTLYSSPCLHISKSDLFSISYFSTFILHGHSLDSFYMGMVFI